MGLVIVAWNCRRAFQKKIVEIQRLNADLYIISEANNPDKYLNHLNGFKYIFTCRPNEKNGLLIFCRDNHNLEEIEWTDYYLDYFQPFIFDDIPVLGVWAKRAYIEDLVVFTKINLFKLKKFIIVGDFNSNVIWDNKHGFRSHTKFNELMDEINHVSLYHFQEGKKFGEEIEATFYLYSNKEKVYHIDYCYLPDEMKSLAKMSIGKFNRWKEFSDHMPLLIEIE